MLSNYDRRRHSVTKLCVHLVFTTKYRRKVMTPEILDEERHELEKPERLDGVGLFTVLDLELK